MALMEVPTTDQVLKQLAEVAGKSQDPTFRLKISRKAQNQMIPTVIATLDGCTIEHLANPETWLAQLAGGGDYFLHASHASNRAISFGPIQVKMAGEPDAVDPFADSKPEWRGPLTIVVPTKPKQQQDNFSAFTSVGVTEPQGASPRNDRPQGSGSVAPASFQQQADPNAFERLRLQQQLDEIARRERAAAEERHRTELELERKRQALELAQLKAELKAEQPKGESQADKLLMIMREEAKERAEKEEARRREEREREDRRAEAERLREERRLDREREERKERDAERQRLEERLAAERKAADERFMAMMQKLNEKPAVDPMIQKMLDSKENQAAEMMKMMQPMMEMAGQNMNMMVQMIHTVAELQGGNQAEADPPLVKLVGKIVDGIQAAATAARGPALRLPGAAAPRPPAPRPPAPRPLNEVPPPAPPPQAAPPAPQGTPNLDGLPTAPEPTLPRKPARKATAMEQIIAMIKAHHNPEEVAHFFFQNVQDPSIAKALADADMQILGAFAPHLMDWLTPSPENQSYVRGLFEKVNEIAPQYGAALASAEEAEEVEPDEEEGEEGDEEDGEEEGEEPEDVTPKAAKAAQEKK